MLGLHSAAVHDAGLVVREKHELARLGDCKDWWEAGLRDLCPRGTLVQ